MSGPRTLGLRLLLAAATLSGASCSGSSIYDNTTGECQPGEMKCEGDMLLSCNASATFYNKTPCSAPTHCDAQYGCISCVPGTTVCENSLEVHSCSADGTVGPVTQQCGFGQTCSSGACVDSCEVAASQFVYLVDSQNNFLSYEPRIDSDPQSLKVIGKLKCSTTSSPYAMAVDRKARAWVLYQDGSLYLVNPQDASCTPSGYTANQQGFTTFGMGFVADGVGSRNETLYGGSGPLNGNKGLARIDPTSLMLSKIAAFPAIDYAVEFTGTGAAELYGYFPSATTGKNFIARINKTTAQYDLTWQLPALAAQPNAWAFAHWGGRYYQFVTVNGQNQILRYDPTTKANIVVQSSTPYPIVGAGVSTCAPYIVG